MNHIANQAHLPSRPVFRNNISRCRDIFPQSESQLHVTVCPARQYCCPVCLTWRGTSQGLKHHIKADVLHKDAEYFELALKERGTAFIESGSDLYVLVFNHVAITGLFLISLKYVGPPSYANRRYFELRLKHGNVEYKVKHGAEEAYNWILHEFLALKVDLKLLGFVPPVDYQQKLQIRVLIKTRAPAFPIIALNEILRDLKCRICRRFMNTNIIQTYEGCSICSQCNASKLLRSKMRNLALESLRDIVTRRRSVAEQDNDVTRQVLAVVECSFCMDYMSLPIKVCKSGHSVCGYCRPRLGICPVCRDMFMPTRNIALESICSKMHYSCIFSDNGCQVKLPYTTIFHERNCSYNIPIILNK